MDANFIGPIDLRNELETKPARGREKPQGSQKPGPESDNPSLGGFRRTEQRGEELKLKKIGNFETNLQERKG